MRRNSYGSYRGIRTTAERRVNCDPDHKQYVRGRRRNLPNNWDDKAYHVTRCWKDRRRTQYRPDGRGEKHVIVLDDRFRWGRILELEQYFKDHDIPYNVRELVRLEVRDWYGYWDTQIDFTKEPKTVTRYRRANRNDNGPNKQETKLVPYTDYVYQYKKVWVTMPHRKHYFRHHLGWEVTWWSDKDIGVDRLLARKYH